MRYYDWFIVLVNVSSNWQFFLHYASTLINMKSCGETWLYEKFNCLHVLNSKVAGTGNSKSVCHHNKSIVYIMIHHGRPRAACQPPPSYRPVGPLGCVSSEPWTSLPIHDIRSPGTGTISDSYRPIQDPLPLATPSMLLPVISWQAYFVPTRDYRITIMDINWIIT